MKKKSKRIAIVNSNEDIIDALSIAIAEEGYVISRGHVPAFRRGVEDVVKFFEREDPDILIWDIAPPYEENWNYFQMVRNLKVSEGKDFVITTTNKSKLQEILSIQTEQRRVIEIVGKPYDVEQVLLAIQVYEK